VTAERSAWSRDPVRLPDELLDRYLAFTGAARPAELTFDALAALQSAHLCAIPFENLDALLDRPVSLEYDALAAKLLSGERGGYCFEHNVLFAGALTALGYGVELLAGRIVVGQTHARPRTHLALRVRLDGGPVLSDVGFGRTALRGPVRMAPGVVQPLGAHYEARLVPVEEELLLQLRPNGEEAEWEDQYLLAPHAQLMPDFVMANYWVSTHPAATMKERVLVLRSLPDGKRSIGGHRLTIDEPGRQVSRDITAGELESVLREEFGIRLPEPLHDLEPAGTQDLPKLAPARSRFADL
jgi:N-hydroxyarylamine O-acetyltransferase